jgi:hypothetical protein
MINSITSRTSSSINSKLLKQQHSRTSSFETNSDLINIDSPSANKKSIYSDSNSSSTNIPLSASAASHTLHKYTKSSTSSIINSSSNGSAEIRVKVNVENQILNNTMYKKMSINDRYRTKDVKRLILEKFFLDPDLSEKYMLVQILDPNLYNPTANNFEPQPQNELIINDNVNVFYAKKNVSDILFVLRKKDPNAIFSNSNTSVGSANISTSSNQNNPCILRQNFVRNSPHSQSIQINSSSSSSNGVVNRNTYTDQSKPPHAPHKTHRHSNAHQQNNSTHNSSATNKNWKFFKKILS